ncbi:rCG41644 [Rattus norvegicus]|uniref:RCG41644 n=1 Tax=Rattus norvegicus TaxID=10116 RepID=A6IH63_RAT|nr:rCG41644 [Rattus norvegicus]
MLLKPFCKIEKEELILIKLKRNKGEVIFLHTKHLTLIHSTSFFFKRHLLV